MEISYQYDCHKNIQSHWYFTQADIYFSKRYFTYNMCIILTKGSGCRKKQKLRFLLILIEQVMTNYINFEPDTLFL